MDRKPVTSSNIASIGYDGISETLEVEFKGGAIYQYFGVHPGIHRMLMTVSSTGRYFVNNVSKKYKYNRMN